MAGNLPESYTIHIARLLLRTREPSPLSTYSKQYNYGVQIYIFTIKADMHCKIQTPIELTRNREDEDYPVHGGLLLL